MLYLYTVGSQLYVSHLNPEDENIDFDAVLDESFIVNVDARIDLAEASLNIIRNILQAGGAKVTICN